MKSRERSRHGEHPVGFAQSYGARTMRFREIFDLTPS
jgi:hypothetical protein